MFISKLVINSHFNLVRIFFLKLEMIEEDILLVRENVFKNDEF